MSEVELDRSQYRAGLSFITQQPDAWIELLGKKFVGFWWFRANVGTVYDEKWTVYYRPIYALLLILLLGGLVLSAKQWRLYSLLYLIFAFFTLTIVAFHVQTRFRWEIEPLFLPLAALCIITLGGRMSGRLEAQLR